jgi:hypothetical protein
MVAARLFQNEKHEVLFVRLTTQISQQLQTFRVSAKLCAEPQGHRVNKTVFASGC